MYFRKTIVLVALAAATAAPSAVALHPPVDVSDPGPTLLTWQASIQKVSPHARPCGARMLQTPQRCVLKSK